MRKKKETSTEERIYVVVAETIFTSDRGTVVQLPGRMAAQACHAVSRMKMHRIADAAATRKNHSLKDFRTILTGVADAGTTTIILSCRDSRELEHVHQLLTKARIRHYDFEDTNEFVYGAGKFRTALATQPVTVNKVRGILDYLPLWTPKD